ncbi:MAG: outer membrane lipoprotein-sorting protein [Saprospiraceae bacterium]|jgi:outer membrane lipoprotein-sorting protein|nr:outer membrane lipoprotein-sorting protein [Saprospiraceae bacterium]
MKTIRQILFSGIILLSFQVVHAQTADEILNKYYENTGGRAAWEKVKSTRSTAKVKTQGMDLNATMVQKAPNKQRVSFTFQGLEFVQPAFDGKTGWQTNFMTMAPEKMEAEDSEILKVSAEDFPDAFLKYKEKGYTLSLDGEETIEGTECFKLKLTKKPIKVDGKEEDNITYYYFEKENYVPIMQKSVMPKGPAKGMTTETYMSDYQEVNGLLFPFTMEQKFAGQTAVTISIEKIEINPEIDDKIFMFPDGK